MNLPCARGRNRAYMPAAKISDSHANYRVVRGRCPMRQSRRFFE
jgi:hypothetical protein